MVEQLSVPLLNRLVDAMFDRADPRADQNIWDLARAAEEVVREVQAEQLTAAYGDPGSTAASELTEKQRKWIARYGPTGRMQVNPVLSTQVARDYSQPEVTPNIPDHAAQLGEVERRLALKAPQYTGDTADKVDQLAQDYQSASQRAERAEKLLRDLAHKVSPKNPITAEKVMGAVQGLMANHQTAVQQVEKLKNSNTAAVMEIEELRAKVTELAQFKEKLHIAEGVLREIRNALDPDGQFEDESLVVLARERMNQREARRQELLQLQERIATQIEANSAEMLRRVLGAAENETLGQAAKRVADAAPVGWKRYQELEKDARAFEKKIRELVGAQPEVDDWDNPRNEQPTLDAVRRLVFAFLELSKELSPEVNDWESAVRHAQDTWNGNNEMKPFPGEKP
jgi:hypothetical protein